MILTGENERCETIERRRAHTVCRHAQLGGPDNGVQDQLAEVGIPPVRVEMTPGETETPSAVGPFNRPTDGKIIRLPGRTCDHDRGQARILFTETNAVIIFLLRGERIDATQDRMIRSPKLRFGLPGLNCGIPVIRRAAGLVVEIAADPFGDSVMKTRRVECAPVKENEAATAFHLAFDGLQVIAGVKWVIRFLAVGAVGSQKYRVGVLERRSLAGPTLEMRFDTDLALKVRRRFEQMFQQYDIFLVFVRLLRMTGDGPGDKHDFFRLVGCQTDERAKAKRQHEENPETGGCATAHR